MRLIYGEDARLIAWAAPIARSNFRPEARTIGIESDDGRLRGVFVFDTFSPSGCMMHVASDGSRTWLRNPRDILTPVFAFPFLQCGYRRVSALVSEHNRASLRFVRGLGAVEEGRLRRAATTGEDMILFGMLREECRWVPAAGQSRRSAL